MNKLYIFKSFILGCLLFSSCASRDQDLPQEISVLFQQVENKSAGVGFRNEVEYTEEFNTYTYRNFYNGAGVGLGDVNNDGKIDIYFCGNIVDNKLYLNTGNFKFVDITGPAGVACPGVWSSGVAMADVNGDGWMDIYICKSGSPEGKRRHNELFINNADPSGPHRAVTFTEMAESYGIHDKGLSTHAAFFDYDRDGDLDCYLLNNSFTSFVGLQMNRDLRKIRDPAGGNKLYRNDGKSFTDVSEAAGIYGSAIGFGLGVTVGDINRDGWQDIYVSNDFFERDYLYLNNKDGTFTEALESSMREISLGSMGADMADINNDGFPELFVTEMTPEPEDRYKTKAMFEDWTKYKANVDSGYYHQFARNVLQLNNGNGTFSEIGRLAGVSRTDWSWGALIFDMDNDGWKDIFVANGIYKDLLDQDYLNMYANPAIVRQLIKEEEQAILKMIEEIPSEKIPNYAFRNNGDLTFTNNAHRMGLALPSHSNGAAYGDLDDDGDLDLVINTVNMPPLIYRNTSSEKGLYHFVVVKLTGDKANTRALGSNLTVHCGQDAFYQELMPMRGFQSTSTDHLVFGVGSHASVDSILVNWWDGRQSRIYDQGVNQVITLDAGQSMDLTHEPAITGEDSWFTSLEAQQIITYHHQENDFNDFNRDRLLFHMRSNLGPRMCVADVNGDHLEDLFIGGAKGFPGTLLLQTTSGNFIPATVEAFEADKGSEDADCLFTDVDNDGDQDLYVASGGNEFPGSSSALVDRLYLNDGKGRFTRADQILPTRRFESTACVEAADYDGDGDADLFVGIRFRPFLYGVPVNGYLLQNDGHGNYINVTREVAPGMEEIGMITDMKWADIDNDNDPDMVIVGEYMPVTVFINEDLHFMDATEKYQLHHSNGWWNTVETADLDHDGDMDFVLGNLGWNSRLKASYARPVTLYVNDFDANGSVEHILTLFNGEKDYPLVLQHDLTEQIPGLKAKYPTHFSYRMAEITDIFTPEQLKNSVILHAYEYSSAVMINEGGNGLKLRPLPLPAQLSPVYSIQIHDFSHDGTPDILLGGNLYRAKPETGMYDASYGVLLLGQGNCNFTHLPARTSGLVIRGEVRDMEILSAKGETVLVVGKNSEDISVYDF